MDLERWDHLFRVPIRQEDVKRFTDLESVDYPVGIDSLRRRRYFVEDVSVTGAAPKSFIRVYEHGRSQVEFPLRWPAYIAKV
ncbi:MAG: hypothetical protein ABI556_15335, partial [Gemmatimonadales bacterium]